MASIFRGSLGISAKSIDREEEKEREEGREGEGERGKASKYLPVYLFRQAESQQTGAKSELCDHGAGHICDGQICQRRHTPAHFLTRNFKRSPMCQNASADSQLAIPIFWGGVFETLEKRAGLSHHVIEAAAIRAARNLENGLSINKSQSDE